VGGCREDATGGIERSVLKYYERNKSRNCARNTPESQAMPTSFFFFGEAWEGRGGRENKFMMRGGWWHGKMGREAMRCSGCNSYRKPFIFIHSLNRYSFTLKERKQPYLKSFPERTRNETDEKKQSTDGKKQWKWKS
jgi:hypothetical protein